MTPIFGKQPALAALIVLLTLSPAVFAKDDPFATQRSLYIEAIKALNKGRATDFQHAADKLKNYPLHPYLQFYELRKRIKRASNREVSAFIKSQADTALAERMRRIWLHTLARKKSWRQFLNTYQAPQSVKLQCHELTARIKTSNTETLADDALALWLVGKSQPEACDPAFRWLQDRDKLTQDLLWQRVRLAMQKNNPSLAGFLARRLPADDAAWIKLWRDAHYEPSRIINKLTAYKDSNIAREIVKHALTRIARINAEQARTKWQTINKQFAFDQQTSAEIERDIALRASWQRLPEAYDWLSAVPEDALDERTREWRVRSAIRSGNWPGILAATGNLTDEQAQKDEWKYWQAAAQENTGLHLESVNGFAALAKERSYYGFLAADEMAWPYEMSDKPSIIDEALITEIEQRPTMVRAQELRLASHMTDARREWAFAIKGMSDTELEHVSEIARRWNWHDRAILTIAKTGNYNDLALRFPLAHKKDVDKQAKRYTLDPSVVFAVIRQESAFNYQVTSPAGARGLMQLMPKTGRRTAQKNNIRLSSLSQLFEPEKNIQIGSTYFKEVSDRWEGHTALAAASYNAGPHRVDHWLSEERGYSAAHWIATIPFTETRRYVQRILSYAAIYEWRLQRPVTKLTARMPDVKKKSVYAQTRK